MSEPARRELPRTGYPRRRAVTACRVCRERKKRCDNLRPACSFCQTINARCEYPERDQATFDPSSLAILDRLSVIEGLMRQHSCVPSPDSASSFPESPVQPRIREQSQAASVDEATWGFDSFASSRVRTDTILQWPCFSEPLRASPRYSFVNFRKEQDWTYLRDIFEPLQPSSEGVNVLIPGSSMDLSTEKADIDALVNRFFILVHVKNPILDRQVVKQYCQEYVENAPAFDLKSCLVLLVCALGSVAPDFHPSGPLGPDEVHHNTGEDAQMSHRYFSEAEKRLGPAIRQPSSLAVQCLCLAGIYHMYNVNPMAAQAMFHAAGYNLQMLTAACNDSLGHSAQIGSSLFWACSKSEREIFAELPIAVSALSGSNQSDRFPIPPQERFMSNVADQWIQAEEDSWYFFLSEIALRRITDKVAEAVGSFFDDPTGRPMESMLEDFAPIALEFERQVQSWRKNLPPCVQFPDLPHPAGTEWKLHTRGPYLRVLELMHRPFIFMAIHQPQLRPLVGDLAAKGLERACLYLQGGHPTLRHHGRWLQLRDELKQICVLFAASRSSVMMPRGWYKAVQDSLRAMKRWQKEAPFVRSYLDIVYALDAYWQSPDTECSGDLRRIIEGEV